MAVMADKVPYPYMSATDMKEYLLERLLYRFRTPEGDPRHNPELNFRIEAVYKQLFGVKMLPIEESHVENICLHGTPGVGKTTSIRAAAAELAKLLGMRLVCDPVPPYEPQPNDLLICTLEMSGEMSNIVMGGIPIADEQGKVNPIKFMNKLPLFQLAIMNRATAGVLLLDDFVNAAPMVQNSALSIALEGRFQMMSLGNTFVALTANLGALDNSDVSPLSDPMTARIGHYYVEDTVEDFVARNTVKFTDGMGDAGVSAFLMQNRDLFILSTDDDRRSSVNGLRTPFPCPRSWDKLANDMRIYRNRVDGTNQVNASAAMVNRMATSFVGKAVAEKFGSFIYAMMTGAEPIAKQLIDTGVLDEVNFKQKYEDGLSSDEQNFGYQLAFCLASHASSRIAAEGIDSIKTYMPRLSTALLKLDPPTIALCVSEFGARMSNLKPEWSVTDKMGKPLHLNTELTTKLCEEIFLAGKAAGNMDRELSTTISHAMVNADRQGGYQSVVNPKKRASGAARP